MASTPCTVPAYHVNVVTAGRKVSEWLWRPAGLSGPVAERRPLLGLLAGDRRLGLLAGDRRLGRLGRQRRLGRLVRLRRLRLPRLARLVVGARRVAVAVAVAGVAGADVVEHAAREVAADLADPVDR